MSLPQDRARTLAIAQDFGAEALELNRQLVEQNPADVASRTRLGRCYLEAGRMEEAETEYRAVLAADPKNRIAAGGLETIERKRYLAANPIAATRPRATERARADRPVAERRSSRSAIVSTSLGPVPGIFNGFQPRDFTELHLAPRGEIQARFAPRVVDLVRRVNALQSSAEIASIREPGRRQLFRLSRADVHAHDDHWFVYNSGARWEPQFNIGMYSSSHLGHWVRVGLGFNLSDSGRDPDTEGGVRRVRDYFGRFQEVLESGRRSLFLGWMIKENGLIEYNRPGPRLDLREASHAAEFLVQADRDRTDWVFLGKWLSPDQADDAAVLAEPVELVRTIDRVFAGLLPLWRAVLGA